VCNSGVRQVVSPQGAGLRFGLVIVLIFSLDEQPQSDRMPADLVGSGAGEKLIQSA